MQKITSAILADGKSLDASIIGRVENHTLPVANALKQVELGERVFRPAASK